MKSEWFSPHKSFLSLKVVWVTVLLLVLMSIISSITIVLNTTLDLDLSSKGFNLFISIFRFPLAIATLIIPMVALLAANHRSEQTKEQIRVTNAQNVFSNYYKHIEEFTKYMSNRIDNKADLRFAHNNIYPNSSSGDYGINAELISALQELDNLPKDVLEAYPSDINEELNIEIRKKYYDVIHKIYSFIYRDSDDYRDKITIVNDDKYSDTYLYEATFLIKHSFTVIKSIESFCRFSIDYISPISRLDLKVLDINKAYIYEKPERSTNGFQFIQNKEEQKFEDANNVLLQLLKASVN